MPNVILSFRTLLVVAAGLPFSAMAQNHTLADVAATVAGVYSSIYVHELGHAAAVKAFGGQNITIQVPPEGQILGGVTKWTQPAQPLTAGQQQLVSVAGFAAANLVSESILRSPGFYGERTAHAFLGANLVSNLRHVYTYYTKVRGRDGYQGNDIDAFELAGGNPHALSAVLVAYSLWSLDRMQQREIPLFFIQLKF